MNPKTPSNKARPVHAAGTATIASALAATSNYLVASSKGSAIAGAVVVWLLIFAIEKRRG
jgi:hypothetical protein